MTAFTDRLYLEWVEQTQARRRGYGGTPPWKRSETAPVLSRSHTSANPAGLAPDAENGAKTDPETALRAMKNGALAD